ncbi:adenine phosphoribosyltransferase [Prochlorococcus marinus]|uniref:adenine phosphoribosyltransferase n=1 Tax=Prochlorococcus marinus TaxID=1219 RepID=UPI0022B3B834|nr:adenine phosphoribosyltransferase [Prochlorococcus marinus]
MLNSILKETIKNYNNFPKNGILFRDISPILMRPNLYKELIEKMSLSPILESADAIISIDARGFLLGSGISLITSKPHILARKPGKLPGELITKSYDLEYGENTLSIQKESINKFTSFAIVDDLLATGGTILCVSKILSSQKKRISGACVAIELSSLKARNKFNFPIYSEVLL